jgi:O-antigen/teichoic acid export membrane protein
VIVRNTVWNLIGLGAPLIVALACIPALIEALGAERFGILTLVWAVVSYFGLFDFGLGRAVTQQLSAAIGAGRSHAAGAIVANACLLLSLLGAAAGAILWLAAPYGVTALRDLGDPREAIQAARAMAWAMPFVVLTSGLRGAMEAKGAFGTLNVIRLATGTVTFVAPLLVVWLGWNDLGRIAWALAAIRAAGCALHTWFVVRLIPSVYEDLRPDVHLVGRLVSLGGWMTVSNIVSPLMSYLDRFVVGTVLSVTAVAYYVTPQEIVTKLLIVATALTSVLFPKLSESFAADEPGDSISRTEHLALSGIYLALFPMTVLLGAFGGLVLKLWVGPVFASEGARAMLIFCFGVLCNSLAQVPYASIQARGRADQTAILHLVELPFFLFALWHLAHAFGVPGAALAWTLRVVVDLIALLVMARRPGLSLDSGSRRYATLVASLTLAAFAAGAIESLWARAFTVSAISALALVVAGVGFRKRLGRRLAVN